MISGFLGPPPPPKGFITTSQREAWELYHQHSDTHGYPISIGPDPETGQERWLVPEPTRIVAERQPMSMAEYLALKAQVQAPPSPGGSDKQARLKDEDRRRIAERERRRAERRRQEEERRAEEERRRAAQPTLFDLEGSA